MIRGVDVLPVYAYKGVTQAGKAAKGQVNADNLRAARARVRLDGVILTELSETAGASVAVSGGSEKAPGRRIDLSFLQRIPALEKAQATRQLATLVGAGIPLVEALSALIDQIDHSLLKSVFSGVRERVNEGSSLADALTHAKQFDNLYISMIRAGEAGGALEAVLARIADYLEDQVRLSNKVVSILIYPAVMLLFALGVVAALVTVVLPQITSLLLSLDEPLPFYTRWIIGGSDFARSWWWALLLAASAIGFAARAVVQTERGRAAYDRGLLRIPLFGKIIRTISIARFTRTLSTLLASGVGIVRSLDIARLVANNTVMGAAIDDARAAILEGAPLARPLRASGEFPSLVTTMIEVGERTGELEAMLAKVASTYDEQVENSVTRLTSLLEPFLILVMVGIVLVIIMATLMPLLQITSSLN